MKMLRKWDYKLHEYMDYAVPDEWDVALYSDDMDKIVSCARCGRKLKFGYGYTSRSIHSNMGFGYTVCIKCHGDELREEGIWARR